MKIPVGLVLTPRAAQVGVGGTRHLFFFATKDPQRGMRWGNDYDSRF